MKDEAAVAQGLVRILALLSLLALPRWSAAAGSEISPPPAMECVTVDDALARAQARNPNLASATADIRRARALVREARAGWLPALTLTANYLRLDGPRYSPSTDPNTGATVSARIAPAGQFGADLALDVPIVNFAQRAEWSHAGDNLAAVEASYDEARRQVALTLLRTYLAVVANQRIAESTERARINAAAHLELARLRLSHGTGRRLDVLRAEDELATDRAGVQGAAISLYRSQEALGIIAGNDEPLDAKGGATLEQLTLDEALESARSQRADVRAAALRLEAARKARADLWALYAPSLRGVFAPFYRNPASDIEPTTGWQVRVLFTLPLYDGGLRYGIADERESVELDASAKLAATVRTAESEVRAAFEALRRAILAREDAQSSAALTREALELATVAYQAGATTNIEVIDAERRARDAETRAAIADDTVNQTQLDILAAAGRLPR